MNVSLAKQQTVCWTNIYVYGILSTLVCCLKTFQFPQGAHAGSASAIIAGGAS